MSLRAWDIEEECVDGEDEQARDDCCFMWGAEGPNSLKSTSGQESCPCLGMKEWGRVLWRCLHQDNMIILAAPALEKPQQGMVDHWFKIKRTGK